MGDGVYANKVADAVIGQTYSAKEIAMDSVVSPYRAEIGRVFQHYKGGHYLLVNIAIDSETLKPIVIYESLKDNRIWVRPAQMFFEKVVVNGMEVSRFQKVPQSDFVFQSAQ